MASEEERRAEVRSELRAEARAKELKDENKALQRLNRTYKNAVKRADEEPNILQLAVTGTSVIAGVGVGVVGHRALRKRTDAKWVKKDDKGQPILKDGKPQRTGAAIFLIDVLPILVGVGGGVATAFSKSGLVASLGGAFWGGAGGVVIDLVFPAKA